MSIPIFIDSSSFTTQQPEDLTLAIDPIYLSSESEYLVYLHNASIWYSWRNIKASKGNNIFKYTYDGAPFTITLPDGNYTIEDINNEIHNVIKTNGHSYADDKGVEQYYIEILANYATSKTCIKITNTIDHTVTADLSSGTLYQLLGTEAKVYNATEYGLNEIDISDGVNALNIHCSISSGSYYNGAKTDVIYTIIPNQSPGSLLCINPNPVIKCPVNTHRIQSINIRITDQSNRILSLEGEPVTYCIVIERV